MSAADAAMGALVRSVIATLVPEMVAQLAPLLARELERVNRGAAEAKSRPMSLIKARQYARVGAETLSIAANLDEKHPGHLKSTICGGPRGGARGPRRHVLIEDVDAWIARGGPEHAARAARERRAVA